MAKKMKLKRVLLDYGDRIVSKETEKKWIKTVKERNKKRKLKKVI